MVLVGIDPGAQGAYITLDENGTLLNYAVFSNWMTAARFLKSLKEQEHLVTLEKVGAALGNSGKSAFTFGANYGGWLALLEVMGIAFVLVPPQAWQPKMLGRFAKGESKKAANAYVVRRYPQLASLKVKEQGVADAICMALYTLKHK